MNNRKGYIKSRLVYTLSLLLYSLMSVANNHSYTFRSITMSDGLSDLLVNVIYKDLNGFVWLGTDNCVDRFDGLNVKHFPFEGTDIKRRRVNAITEDALHNLWIGNNMGLWYLDVESETLTRKNADIIDFPVYCLISDTEGTLYIGTEKGLFTLREGQFAQYLPDKNHLSQTNRVKAMTLGANGELWLGTAFGLHLFIMDNGDFQSFQFSTGQSGENAFRTITRVGKTLYLGTENQGLFSFDTETKDFIPSVDVGSTIISSLSSDGNELIYVATDGNGVHIISHSQKKIIRSFRSNINDRSTIRSNSVYSLLVDKEGIMWVGFYQSGFDYSMYQNGLFQLYSFAPFFDSQNKTIRSFLVHDKEKLIGTRDGLFYIHEGLQEYKIFKTPELRSNLIFAITYYRGKFYIGTYGGGLSLIDPQTLKVSHFDGNKDITFVNGHIFCMQQDSQDNLWIGTSNGVYCYNAYTNSLRHFNHTNSQMPEGNTYEIFFDSSGKGWICTDNGLSIYDSQTQSMRSTIFPEGFFHKEKIRTVYEDSKNKLYFLLDRGGFMTSDLLMRNYESTPVSTLLHGNAYTTIIEDNEGTIWFGSDDGIICRKRNGKEYLFNFIDGIPDPTFMYPSYKDKDGLLWFGNNKGLLTIDPSKVDSIKRYPYKIVITDIRLKGISIPSGIVNDIRQKKTLTLKEDENSIGFSFVDLSYSEPSAAMYRYKLEGNDEEWHIVRGDNEVNYYDLQAGQYIFRLCGSGDEQSEVVLAIEIGSWFSIYSKWIWMSLLLLTTIICIVLFKKRLARNTPGFVRSEKGVPFVEQEKYKMNKLSEQECQQLHDKLKEYMESHRPYINPELKIAELANLINTSSFSLSYLFNQYLNQSYYDFINQYRIEEFKKLVNDPQYTRYTLTALATRCGFSSRASFFRSFKKAMDITPNEYIQSLGHTDSEEKNQPK